MSTGALAMRPRLRPDLTIIRRETRGQIDFIVKEPTEGKYSRFGEAEIGLMNLMDGARTPEEIADAAESTLGFVVSPGSVADFAQKLKRLGLVERTPSEQHLMLLERLRTERKRRARRRTKGSLLRIQFSAGDPDRLFTRWERKLRWMWTPAYAWFSVALFVSYFVILVVRWPEFWGGLKDFVTASNVSAWDYALVYVVMLTVITIHEFGHGLTTKHFGGEVHDIGGMFLYFMPALYCNTNDAWLFERRSHRLWVTFAGPWIQLSVAAAAGIAWLFMEPGTLGYRLTLFAFVLAGLTNVVTNLNPLIPLDGYYALSDYLEIPNLRNRAFEYCQAFARRHLLGRPVAGPAVTPRERRVFLIYGTLAFFYGFVAIFIGLSWLAGIFGHALGPWIWVLLAFLIGRKALPRLVRARSVVGSTGRTMAARWRASPRAIRIGAAVAAAGLAFLLLPWNYRANAPFRVEAARQLAVFAAVPGVVDRVLVEEGDSVAAGQPLVVLWNPDLESAVMEARRRVGLLEVQQAMADARGDHTAAATAAGALAEATEQLTVLETRGERLVVRAPIGGIVLGHDLDERLGEALTEGDSLLAIASLGARIARVRVPLAEARDLALGQTVHAKVPTWPGHKFRGRVARIAPAARGDWIEAVVPFPVSGPAPSPGMAGTAKIETGRGTIGSAIARSVRGNVRLDFLM